MSMQRDRYDDRPRERERSRERRGKDYDRDFGGRGDGRVGRGRHDRSRSRSYSRSPIRGHRDRDVPRERSRERPREREREKERDARGRGNDSRSPERGTRGYDGKGSRGFKRDEVGRDRDPATRDSRPMKASKEEVDEEEAPAPVDMTADMTEQEIQMMLAMGIPFSFDTTQGKDVEDPNAKASGIKTSSKRTARQFMNRRGGFNRPLPAERTGQKVVRD